MQGEFGAFPGTRRHHRRGVLSLSTGDYCLEKGSSVTARELSEKALSLSRSVNDRELVPLHSSKWHIWQAIKVNTQSRVICSQRISP